MSNSPRFRYNAELTRRHPVALKEPQYLVDMDELFRNEEHIGSRHRQPSHRVRLKKPVWTPDLSAREHKKAGNITCSTVDFLAVVCRKKQANPTTLLVELKLGVQDPTTIALHDLHKKYDGTCELLAYILSSQALESQKMLVIHRGDGEEQRWQNARRSTERGPQITFMTERVFRKTYSIRAREAAIPVNSTSTVD